MEKSGLREDGFKLPQGRFRLSIIKNVLMKRVVKVCNRLPRKVAELLSLEIFQSVIDVVIRGMVGLVLLV